jgi:hypothetical protein
VNKTGKKLALHRDTLRSLSVSALSAAQGGNATQIGCTLVTYVVSCLGTCNVTHCGCPTLVQDCTTSC